jgi:hypothetical protein
MAAAAPGSEFLLKSCGFLARPGVYLAGGKHTAGCSYLFRVELGPGGEWHKQYQAKKLRSGQHPGWHPNSGNAIRQIRNHSGASADGDIAADADLLDQGSADANPAAFAHLNLTGQAGAGANMHTVG